MQIHDEQHIKKKSINTQGKYQNTWSLRNNNRPNDKGKEFEEDTRFKGKPNKQYKETRAGQGKNANSQRARDITCFKCKVKGH